MNELRLKWTMFEFIRFYFDRIAIECLIWLQIFCWPPLKNAHRRYDRILGYHLQAQNKVFNCILSKRWVGEKDGGPHSILANFGLILYVSAIWLIVHSAGLCCWSLMNFMACTNDTRPIGILSDSLKPSGNDSVYRYCGNGLVFLMFSVYKLNHKKLPIKFIY